MHDDVGNDVGIHDIKLHPLQMENGCLWMNFINDDVGIYPWHCFVTWMESIEVFLTFATVQNLEVYQMDVKVTFFNDDVSKEIYICNN